MAVSLLFMQVIGCSSKNFAQRKFGKLSKYLFAPQQTTSQPHKQLKWTNIQNANICQRRNLNLYFGNVPLGERTFVTYVSYIIHFGNPITSYSFHKSETNLPRTIKNEHEFWLLPNIYWYFGPLILRQGNIFLTHDFADVDLWKNVWVPSKKRLYLSTVGWAPNRNFLLNLRKMHLIHLLLLV